ncbi:P4HA1 [Symbiodinium sp. CCMP2592]|nr:P4HA1 [Symbiodinium sp. CCMP2592]
MRLASPGGPSMRAGIVVFTISLCQWVICEGHADDIDCGRMLEDGDCVKRPRFMELHCGGCGNFSVHEELRGRFLFEDAVSPLLLKDLLALAPEVVVPGDGYGGFGLEFSSWMPLTGLYARHKKAAERQWPLRAASWRCFVSATGNCGDSHPLHSDDGCIYQEPTDDLSESCIAPEACTHLNNGANTCCAESLQDYPDISPVHCAGFSDAFSVRLGTLERMRRIFICTDRKEETFEEVTSSLPATAKSEFGCDLQQVVWLVAIAASSSNLHGVEHLEAGTRCHVGVWVAADSEDTGAYGYQRYSLQQAESILSGVLPPGSRPQVQDWRQEASGHQQMCAAASNVKAKAEAIGNRELQEVEVLADLPGPQILRVGGFLSAQEAQHIIALARPMLKDGVVIESGQLVRAKYRTSRTAWLDEDPVLRNISKRIEDLTGLSLQSAEQFQVAHYTAENQGSYEPHFDWGTEVEVTGAFGTPEDSGFGSRQGTW